MTRLYISLSPIHGTPIETVDYAKRRQIEKMTRLYITKEKVPEDTYCRFDVLGIVLPDNGEPLIEHILNALSEETSL